MSDLDDQLLKAHAADDRWLLVSLYAEAADATDDDEARYFYLTHAYVFALEQNHPSLPDLKARLVAAGRETE
ncbi:MAG: hypothetical protein GJ676_03680 [Rhodobacteraceae bacterium]|nr:hypothetical protein [Paracoccaceae bacterium]